MDYKSFDTLNDTFNVDNDIEDMEDSVEHKTESKPKSKSLSTEIAWCWGASYTSMTQLMGERTRPHIC